MLLDDEWIERCCALVMAVMRSPVAIVGSVLGGFETAKKLSQLMPDLREAQPLRSAYCWPVVSGWTRRNARSAVFWFSVSDAHTERSI